MNHIFISYSRKNEAVVTRMCDELRRRGIPVWQDISGKGGGIPYSTKWFGAIVEALYSSSGAIVFDSEHWKQSGPCQKEHQIITEIALPKLILPTDELMQNGELDGSWLQTVLDWIGTIGDSNDENTKRTWLLSTTYKMRLHPDDTTGIPHFRRRKQAKAFLNEIEQCRALATKLGYREADAELADDIDACLSKAERITKSDMRRRTIRWSEVIFISLMLFGSLLAYHIINANSEKQLAALEELDRIHDQVDIDPMEAVSRLANDDLVSSQYNYVLISDYVEILDRNYPAAFFQHDSADARAISALPRQKASMSYSVELSTTEGLVWVTTTEDDPNRNEAVAVQIATIPQDYAIDEDSHYLAIAAANKAYVFDLERGYRAIELSYCYRDISCIGFADNYIFAVTDAGDVYLWENPIANALETNITAEEVSDRGFVVDGSECTGISADGRFEITGKGTGEILISIHKVNSDASNEAGGTASILWKCSEITEPLQAVMLSDDSTSVSAVGRSGSVYTVEIGDILTSYSDNYLTQLEPYRAASRAIYDRMNELQLTASSLDTTE